MASSSRLDGFGRLAAAALCAAALLLVAGGARADAAGVVAANGQITGCFKSKGKTKGSLRVVPAGKRCKKGERRLFWNQQGQPGATGTPGPAGPGGSVSALETRVTELETILSGITNTELLSTITNAAKLDGIGLPALQSTITNAAKLDTVSGTQLTDAVAAVADVNALCTQMSTVTSTLTTLRNTVGALSILGTLPIVGNVAGLLTIDSTGLPAGLPAFACP